MGAAKSSSLPANLPAYMEKLVIQVAGRFSGKGKH
jgi:hypothetical protein